MGWKLSNGSLVELEGHVTGSGELVGVMVPLGSSDGSGANSAPGGAAPALKYLCTSVASAAGAAPALKYLCTSVASAGGAAPALKYLCTSVAMSAAPAGQPETFGVIAGSDADPDQSSTGQG